MSNAQLLALLSFCRDGSELEDSAVATGSYNDVISYSGKYDVVVGATCAIEAIKCTTNRFELT